MVVVAQALRIVPANGKHDKRVNTVEKIVHEDTDRIT